MAWDEHGIKITGVVELVILWVIEHWGGDRGGVFSGGRGGYHTDGDREGGVT